MLILFNNYFCFGLKNKLEYRFEIETQSHKYVCPIGGYGPLLGKRRSPLIGTLIHPRWCITAAHFTPLIGTPFVIEGEKYLVESVVYHSGYSPHRDSRYDLALVKINRPVLNYPLIERERDDASCSLQNWIISLKYRDEDIDKEVKNNVITTGVVELYSPNIKGDPLFSHHFYTCFCTSRYKFNRGEYTFDDSINACIASFRLKPKLELSRFRVRIENGDSGSPVLNCPPGCLTVPRMTLRLNGIVLTRLKPDDDDDEDDSTDKEGHIGKILRLPHTGLNEFIDHEILKDSLK